MSEYQVYPGEIPRPREYCELRLAAGLSSKTVGAAEVGLPRSLYSVVVRRDRDLVAMGRLVGDGLHVQVVDIAVHPDHQGQGLSRKVMEVLMTHVEEAVPECAIVSLLADVDWLYHKFGFVVSDRSVGMIYRRE